MKKRFELWTEYQTIQFQPRRYVGSSVYELLEKSRRLIEEIFMESVSIYDDPKNQQIGRNLAALVLKKFEYNEEDEIGTIDKFKNSGLRIIESSILPITFSTSRSPVGGSEWSRSNFENEMTFVEGFIEYMKSNRKNKK